MGRSTRVLLELFPLTASCYQLLSAEPRLNLKFVVDSFVMNINIAYCDRGMKGRGFVIKIIGKRISISISIDVLW